MEGIAKPKWILTDPLVITMGGRIALTNYILKNCGKETSFRMLHLAGNNDPITAKGKQKTSNSSNNWTTMKQPKVEQSNQVTSEPDSQEEEESLSPK